MMYDMKYEAQVPQIVLSLSDQFHGMLNMLRLARTR